MNRTIETARITHLARAGADRLRAAVERSNTGAVLQGVRTAIGGAREGSRTDTAVGRLRSVVANSVVGGVAARVADRVRRTFGWYSGARVREAVTTGETLIRQSWLYRWLTAEPEPDVIVIDLRETMSIGPILAVIAAVADRLLPAAGRARLVRALKRLGDVVYDRPLRVAGVGGMFVAAIATGAAAAAGSIAGILTAVILAGASVGAARSDRSWPELRETRTMQVLIAAFEPPEPPASVDRDGPTAAHDRAVTDTASRNRCDGRSDKPRNDASANDREPAEAETDAPKRDSVDNAQEEVDR